MNPPPPAEGLATRLFVLPALRTQPDRRLVTLVRDGYDTAFEEIVRRYGKALTRYAAAIVGGRSEDVAQEAFAKALLALRRDPGAEIDLRPWLYRIVRNTALNDLRDRPPDTAELTPGLAGGGRSAAEEAERREELAELMQRLRELPEPQRAAIVMRELEGLSHEEIASALGLSGGGARQAIYRARVTLRDGLGLAIPLPLLRMLIEQGGAELSSEAAAAGAGGAAIAIGGAGAGTALKVGVVTAVLAGSVGTGLALDEERAGDRQARAATSATAPGGDDATESPASAPAERSIATKIDASSGPGHGNGDGSRGHGGPDHTRGEDESGDSGGDGSGHGPFRHSDGGVEDQSGPGHSGSGGGEPSGGVSADDSSGDGSGSSGSGTSGSGSSGSGTSGSGSSGSGTSGGGSSGSSDSLLPPPPTAEDDSSGSGSDGTDDSGSGSSGSGPG